MATAAIRTGGAASRFAAAEITLQCGLAVAADARPKRSSSYAAAPKPTVYSLGNAAAQTAYPSSGTAGVDARQQVVAGNHVLFAVDFGVQCGGAKSVLRSNAMSIRRVQARVGKEVLPAQVGGADAVVEGVVFEGFGNFNLRLFVFGIMVDRRTARRLRRRYSIPFECLFVHKVPWGHPEIRVSGFQTTFCLVLVVRILIFMGN